MDPHPLWHALQQHMIKSLPEYSIILGLLAVAIVFAMIRPPTMSKWIQTWKLLIPGGIPKTLGQLIWCQYIDLMDMCYTWFYEALQGFMASRHPPTQTVTTISTTPMVTVKAETGEQGPNKE